nr:retrovirus-related Pol polyprotein from transposon TNT 1-94 [Tanacetum cinerariifolium]
MRHDTSSYSNQPQKESIKLINFFNNSSGDFLKDLFSNQPSGNPIFLSHPKLTSPKVQNDIFDLEGGNVLPDKLLDLDSTKDLHPPLHVNLLSGSTTYSSSSNPLLEEFDDELALITFPLKYDDDLQFDVESDLKEIEFLLHQDIDSSLKDSIDQSNLTNLADNFVDYMPEMFTDEHALDYSSPPIFDGYDDDFLEVESDIENVYDDPFDSKREKIKEVDAKPSTNNKDKVFNPCILNQENPFEIITRVVQDKKLATSNASLMLEDFDPPLYKPLFFKEVPSIPGNLKTNTKGFYPSVFISSASLENHDKEEVSSDDNEMVEVKVLMALAEENDVVSKEGTKNDSGCLKLKVLFFEIMILRLYDLTDESAICSTPVPPLKKLDDAEPISGPKTIKSILRSKFTFKAKNLKGVTINEPSSATAKGDNSSSASKVNPAPADSGCSRHMTIVKSYLHKYEEQPGPKVVFGDDSTCTTEGYGSIKFNDHMGKFDEKVDDGYLLGYSLLSKAFRVFNIRRQQTKETYHITFNESPDAIKFLKPLVDNINIAENERYPPDEYLHSYEPSQRWSQDKHIELVNIIGNLGAGMLTRAMAKELGFESNEFPNHVCKLEKALYGLKKAPRACKNFDGTPNNLGPDLSGKAVNETQYRGMIRSLMYLTASRPDIQFSTCLCARYQANPKESYLIVVKRIFRKSTSGARQLLEGKIVCICATAGCCANILWMKSQLTDYDIIYEKVPIFCDNTSAIAISNSLILHSITKHIDIRYHFIKDHILKGDIELHFILTQYQLADIFTKPLDEPTFKRLIVELGEKTGGLEQISNKDATILYCLANGIKVYYAKLIWEDIIHNLSQNTREKVVPYPSQTKIKGPPFTNHMKAIYNLDMPVDSKAPKHSLQAEEVPQGKNPGAKSRLKRKQHSKHTSESKTEASKSKTGQSKKETQSSSAKDKSPSHPLPPTLMVDEMHKETQQAAGGLTSLEATSKEGAHP